MFRENMHVFISIHRCHRCWLFSMSVFRNMEVLLSMPHHYAQSTVMATQIDSYGRKRSNTRRLTRCPLGTPWVWIASCAELLGRGIQKKPLDLKYNSNFNLLPEVVHQIYLYKVSIKDQLTPSSIRFPPQVSKRGLRLAGRANVVIATTNARCSKPVAGSIHWLNPIR